MSRVKGCLSLAGRVLAGLAAAALVVMLPITLLARNVALVLFDPQALTRAVSERLIESGVLRETIVGNLLGNGPEAGGLSLQGATQYLTEEEREAVINLLVPEQWITDQLLQVSTGFYAWFDTPSTRLLLAVDTAPVAESLRGDAAARVVELIVESWPACTLDDVGQMIGIGAIPGEQGFPFCEPPEPLRGVVVSAAAGSLGLLGQSLPARLPIVDQDFEDTDQLLEAKEQVRMIRFVARSGILLSLALLGTITVLVVRSWKSLSRWWGTPLLMGGLLAFLPVLFGERLLRLLVNRLTAGISGAPALTELAQALAQALGAAVLRPQAFQAAAITAIGLGLVLLSLRSRRPAVTTSYASETAAQAAGTAETLVPPASAEDDAGDRPSGMFG